MKSGKAKKHVDDYAFTNCGNFTGVLELPSNLQYIGVSAFSGCRGLSGSLFIPSAVEVIGETAFFQCTGFERVIFEGKSTNVSFMSFSRMHNRCFTNPPEKLIENNPEIYSSDNMDGKIIPKGPLNMNCKAFVMQ